MLFRSLEFINGSSDSAFAAQRHLDGIAPGFVMINSNIADHFRIAGHADSALHYDTLADRFVGRPTSGTALSLVALSRIRDAEAHYARMLAAYKSVPVLPEMIARAALAVGRRDDAVSWMERAADEHSDLIFWVLQYPDMRPLLTDRRIRAIVDRAHAPATLRQALGMGL